MVGIIILLIILCIVGSGIAFVVYRLNSCSQGEGGILCKAFHFFI